LNRPPGCDDHGDQQCTWYPVRAARIHHYSDRLDPMFTPMFVNKRHHYLTWRSDGCRRHSAWAQKAAALRSISLACFSSRFSRSSSLSRSRSVELIPLRLPWSVSDWRTHRRNVSAVQPILLAIDSIADHCELCWCC
jgi:hypothetical protein